MDVGDSNIHYIIVIWKFESSMNPQRVRSLSAILVAAYSSAML